MAVTVVAVAMVVITSAVIGLDLVSGLGVAVAVIVIGNSARNARKAMS